MIHRIRVFNIFEFFFFKRQLENTRGLSSSAVKRPKNIDLGKKGEQKQIWRPHVFYNDGNKVKHLKWFKVDGKNKR